MFDRPIPEAFHCRHCKEGDKKQVNLKIIENESKQLYEIYDNLFCSNCFKDTVKEVLRKEDLEREAREFNRFNNPSQVKQALAMLEKKKQQINKL